MTKIKLPAGTTAIPSSMFRFNYALESIVIPSGVVSVGSSAFESCSNLKTLDFPSTLVSIAALAFSTNGTTVFIFRSVLPPALANINAFTGIMSTVKIFVPDSSVAAYKAATNWSTYANYIYPLSTYGGS
jgi:hypothetical protein